MPDLSIPPYSQIKRYDERQRKEIYYVAWDMQWKEAE
jgi:hypothetical protein